MDRKNSQPIKVFARQRPYIKSETESRSVSVVQHATTKELFLKKDYNEKKYNFDHVFVEQNTQLDVFNVVAAPMISSVIGGYNCTISAYGPTGTGKTHTIYGELKPILPSNLKKDSDVGLVPRVAEHLFSELSKESVKTEYTVQISFFEIYNEDVHDLLCEYTSLRIYDDPINKGTICIKDLSKVTVFNADDVNTWLLIGQKEREAAYSKLNIDPTKTHSVFIFSVNVRELTGKGEEIIKSGKLQLIKMGGCENRKTSGERLRDATIVNRSIITVGRVIKALTQKMQHIPFRDSKLTRILQDSLCGTSKTAIIGTFSTSPSCWDDTIQCLELVQPARTILNFPQVNLRKKQASLLGEIEEELTKLREELAAARAGEGFYVSAKTYEQMTEEVRTKNTNIVKSMQQIKDLEDHLKSQKIDYEILTESFKKTKEHLDEVSRELEEAIEKNKQNEGVIEDLKTNLDRVREDAVDLLDVCETSTRNVDVIHRKFEEKCAQNSANADIAYSSVNAAVACLHDIADTGVIFHEHETNHAQEIFHEINVLRNRYRQSLCDVLKIEDDIVKESNLSEVKHEKLPESEIQDFFRNTYQGKSSSVNVLQNILSRAKSWKKLHEDRYTKLEKTSMWCVANLQRELEQLVVVGNNLLFQLMEIRKRCNQAIAQLHDSERTDRETVKVVEESLKQLKEEENVLQSESIAVKGRIKAVTELKNERAKLDENLIQSRGAASNHLENACISLHEFNTDLADAIHAFDEMRNLLSDQAKVGMDAVNECVMDMIQSLQSKISNKHTVLRNFVHEWKGQIVEVVNKIKEIDVQSTNKITKDVDMISTQITTQNDTVGYKIDNTLKQVQQKSGTINFTGHCGDTPVRRIYNFSKDVDNTMLIEGSDSDKEN